MAQAQAGADFGIAGAIAGATAGKAGAAAGSIYSAAVSKAAGDLTRALNAVQTGFVDAATAASVKATKAIAAAETVERKAVAKADVVLAQDLQSAWGTYAAAERSAVTLNARERATIGADYKKDVAGAELAAVKAVAPARKTSMIATAEANGGARAGRGKQPQWSSGQFHPHRKPVLNLRQYGRGRHRCLRRNTRRSTDTRADDPLGRLVAGPLHG
ncbi:MAG: hypothetical protein NT171_17715 [Planctomycetota bacterium]|nr:hypothetical protein [Planctomycetota bacterium]